MKKLVPITETHYEVYYCKHLLGSALQQEDGFFYFQFECTGPGLWEENTLKAITESLHELNKDWDEKINEYFEKKEKLKERYKNISTEKSYNLLLRSGMFFEFHPELTGNWEEDKLVMELEEEPDEFIC